jgi:transposase
LVIFLSRAIAFLHFLYSAVQEKQDRCIGEAALRIQGEAAMSKRPRRSHAPAFKAKVVLRALKCEQTLVEPSQRYQVHPNQITEQKQLLENAPDIFFSKDSKADQAPSAKDLHAKIDQLSIENDFYQAHSLASAMRAQSDYR